MPDHVNTFTARGVVTRIARADLASKARAIVAFDVSDHISQSGDVCILFSGTHLPPSDLAVGDVCDVQFRLHGMYGTPGHERHVSVLLTGGRVTVIERAGATGERGAPAAREGTPEEFAARLANMKRSRDWRRKRD